MVSPIEIVAHLTILGPDSIVVFHTFTPVKDTDLNWPFSFPVGNHIWLVIYTCKSNTGV